MSITIGASPFSPASADTDSSASSGIDGSVPRLFPYETRLSGGGRLSSGSGGHPFQMPQHQQSRPRATSSEGEEAPECRRPVRMEVDLLAELEEATQPELDTRRTTADGTAGYGEPTDGDGDDYRQYRHYFRGVCEPSGDTLAGGASHVGARFASRSQERSSGPAAPPSETPSPPSPSPVKFARTNAATTSPSSDRSPPQLPVLVAAPPPPTPPSSGRSASSSRLSSPAFDDIDPRESEGEREDEQGQHEQQTEGQPRTDDPNSQYSASSNRRETQREALPRRHRRPSASEVAGEEMTVQPGTPPPVAPLPQSPNAGQREVTYATPSPSSSSPGRDAPPPRTAAPNPPRTSNADGDGEEEGESGGEETIVDTQRGVERTVFSDQHPTVAAETTLVSKLPARNDRHSERVLDDVNDPGPWSSNEDRNFNRASVIRFAARTPQQEPPTQSTAATTPEPGKTQLPPPPFRTSARLPFMSSPHAGGPSPAASPRKKDPAVLIDSTDRFAFREAPPLVVERMTVPAAAAAAAPPPESARTFVTPIPTHPTTTTTTNDFGINKSPRQHYSPFAVSPAQSTDTDHVVATPPVPRAAGQPGESGRLSCSALDAALTAPRWKSWDDSGYARSELFSDDSALAAVRVLRPATRLSAALASGPPPAAASHILRCDALLTPRSTATATLEMLCGRPPSHPDWAPAPPLPHYARDTAQTSTAAPPHPLRPTAIMPRGQPGSASSHRQRRRTAPPPPPPPPAAAAAAPAWHQPPRLAASGEQSECAASDIPPSSAPSAADLSGVVSAVGYAEAGGPRQDRRWEAAALRAPPPAPSPSPPSQSFSAPYSTQPESGRSGGNAGAAADKADFASRASEPLETPPVPPHVASFTQTERPSFIPRLNLSGLIPVDRDDGAPSHSRGAHPPKLITTADASSGDPAMESVDDRRLLPNENVADPSSAAEPSYLEAPPREPPQRPPPTEDELLSNVSANAGHPPARDAPLFSQAAVSPPPTVTTPSRETLRREASESPRDGQAEATQSLPESHSPDSSSAADSGSDEDDGYDDDDKGALQHVVDASGGDPPADDEPQDYREAAESPGSSREASGDETHDEALRAYDAARLRELQQQRRRMYYGRLASEIASLSSRLQSITDAFGATRV